MQEFIAKIAKGQKASKNLTWEEAKRAMRALIEGEATQAQVGAFLVAMRFKMESVTELASFAAAAGASILMHGYDGIPGRLGNAGVLKALGLPIDLEPKAVADMVAKQGFAYLDIALYHPPIYRFLDMRQELGVRNVF